MNPMLHTLGAFAFELPRLRSVVNFGANSIPWPVLITDVRVISEVIGGPAELLHYLLWRSELPTANG